MIFLMECLDKEKLNGLAEIFVTPVFLVKDKELLALNQQARSMCITYHSISPILNNSENIIEGKQLAVAECDGTKFYVVNGRTILFEDKECWLLAVQSISEQETFQDITRISTARMIMLQMSNDFAKIETEQDVYDSILDNCGKAIQHQDLCSLMLVHNGIGRIVSKHGYNDDACKITFSMNETFIGVATKGKFDQTIIINDLEKYLDVYHTEIKIATSNMLLGSTLCTPVYVKHKLYAILSFDSPEKNAFKDKDVELLELIKSNVEPMLTNHLMRMEIVHLSTTDMLTGLYNRAYLKTVLKKHGHEPFYVGMFDMNDLKGTNDGHGHINGDAIIRKMAVALQKTFPNDSYLFRLGGDEFLGIFGNISLEEIQVKIKEMRESFIASPVTLSDQAVTTISFSCGFAFHKENESFDAVLSQADHNMYIEKRRTKGFLISSQLISDKDLQ